MINVVPCLKELIDKLDTDFEHEKSDLLLNTRDVEIPVKDANGDVIKDTNGEVATEWIIVTTTKS